MNGMEMAGIYTPIPNDNHFCFGTPQKRGITIAVALHLFYIDLIDEAARYLKNVIVPFDLVVTTPFATDIPTIVNRFSSIAESISIFVSENRGRDIGPFLDVYRAGALDPYNAVLKLHSKKSKYSRNGELWRDDIYRELSGSSLTVLRTLRLFDRANVGMVGPHPYYLTNERYWGVNRSTVARLLVNMGLIGPDDDPELGFFAGSMFWFNPKAFMPLKTVHERELKFEAECGMQDGTMAHALERAFGPVARLSGFLTTSLILNGEEIDHTNTNNNIIPVL